MSDLIVVAGALANKPLNGGEAWVRLSWALGLRRLGFRVELVEQIRPGALLGADGRPASFRDSLNAEWFRRVTRAFGLEREATLVPSGDHATIGRSRAELRDLADEAALLVNISGHLTTPWLKPRFRRRAFVDIDPGFTQFWLAQGVPGHGVDGHHMHYTIAENIGRRDCGIPTVGLDWRTVRQPVVLDDWPASAVLSGAPMTTVASWRGAFGPVEHEGRRYGIKAHEFRKVLDLPALVDVPLEIALDIHPADAADLTRLNGAGWRVSDPRQVVPSPESFRDYVQASAGEFSVAQGIYVETGSGWFSDRTVRYLASGRPAVVQDTGLGRTLPLGRGLHAFRSLAEAAAAIRRLAADPEGESAAARAIAEEHFDSDRVLGRFADQALSYRAAGRGGTAAASAAAAAAVPGGDGTGGRPAARAERLRIVVAGRLAASPGQGGAAWAVLQYVLGLRELGHDVLFVEPLAPEALRPAGSSLAASANAAYFADVMSRFELEERAALMLEDSAESVGLDPAELLKRIAGADMLINLSGVLRDPRLLEALPRRLYVDMDPAFTQLWQDAEGIDMGLVGHTHHATVGLALAAGETDLPDCGVRWHATLPPVVLSHWPRHRRTVHLAATTVANWRAYGSIERGGVLYGQKAHSLRRLMELPSRTETRFSIALSIHRDERSDLAALRRNGWDILDPARLTPSPSAYRSFVLDSMMEFGVAKSGYVESRCGWVSDRSACYLAAGRPVLAQDTGFGAHLPAGSGLLGFGSMADAVAGLDAIRSGYDRHSAAARALAEEYFDSRRVLGRLIEITGRAA